MTTLAQRYHRLKTSIGGNREKRRYEETFGMPHEEQAYITPPNAWQRRILGELAFVLTLEKENPTRYGEPLSKALTFLQEAVDTQGTLTKQDVSAAEAILAPVADEARTYSLILAGHAHIDMNWMWSWQETVAATLDTFRTMLALMEEYPEFHFSQSQASVYRIVEEYDPDMMTRIRNGLQRDDGRLPLPPGWNRTRTCLPPNPWPAISCTPSNTFISIGVSIPARWKSTSLRTRSVMVPTCRKFYPPAA